MRYRCAPAPKVHRACIQFQICVRCYISGLIFVCLKRLHMCFCVFLSRVFPCLCLFLDVTLRGQLLCLCVCFCRVRVVDLVCLCLHSPACVFPLLSLYIYIYIYVLFFLFCLRDVLFFVLMFRLSWFVVLLIRILKIKFFINNGFIIKQIQFIYYKHNNEETQRVLL